VVAATVEELRDVYGYAEPGVLRADADGRLPAARVELLVPIARHGEPWGALTLRGPEPFGDDDQRLLETIAGHVGAAVGAADRREALEAERREADAALETAVAALRRAATTGLSAAEVSALLADIGR
jgi:GAF domain-containing protein